MQEKRMTESDVVEQLSSGSTIGIGGWGSRRKPMSLVRCIARSDLTDLTLVTYGGPDVGVLCALGKVRRVVTGFVSLDSIPLEPHFRRARQKGRVEVVELDEGMLQWGLKAAAHRLPFLPIRAGQGADVHRTREGAETSFLPPLQTVRSPYGGEELLAMPALKLDVALVHMNRGDAFGNGQYLGPDPYFDDLFCRAADRAYMSVERIVDTAELSRSHCVHSLAIQRMWINGVVEAPGGAHFTDCVPDYGRDEGFQSLYAKTARDETAWEQFQQRFLAVDEAQYQDEVRRQWKR